MTEPAVLHSDGASFGNPGASGIGFVLKLGGETVEYSADAGFGTNNQAEYRALIVGLEEAVRRGVKELIVRADSELLIKQMKGEYRVRDRRLQVLKAEVDALRERFDRVRFEHVFREGNARADELAKAGAELARSKGVRGAESSGEKGLLE